MKLIPAIDLLDQKCVRLLRGDFDRVTFYEKESDIRFSSLARRIFDSDLSLDQKMHLRYFVE